MSSETNTGQNTVVVVGHGMVGHRFVQEMRQRDTDNRWRVEIVCEETDPAYDRVGLSPTSVRGSGIRWRSTATRTRVTISWSPTWARRSPGSTGHSVVS